MTAFEVADPHGVTSIAKNAPRLSHVGTSGLLAANYFFLLDNLSIFVEKSSFNPIFSIDYLETKRIFVLVVLHECSYLFSVVIYLCKQCSTLFALDNKKVPFLLTRFSIMDNYVGSYDKFLTIAYYYFLLIDSLSVEFNIDKIFLISAANDLENFIFKINR